MLVFWMCDGSVSFVKD
ncbi:H-X9-DG-CTERM domain-containing protein [Planktothrix sp.]